MITSISTLINEIPLFQGVGWWQRRALASKLVARQYEPGAEIVQQGETGSGLYIVVSGCAEATRVGQDGQKTAAGYFAPYDYFGEIEILAGGARVATVVALEPTDCLVLLRPDFLRFMRTVPSLSAQVAETMAKRFRATLEETMRLE